MPTPAKKVPVRMCTGCREHKPKKELIRVVRSPEGEISIDFTGKNPDGALICAQTNSALQKRVKQNSWNGHWKPQSLTRFMKSWNTSLRREASLYRENQRKGDSLCRSRNFPLCHWRSEQAN